MSTELQNKKVYGMTQKVLDTVLKLEANSASIDSVNRRLDDDEKNICKKIVIIFYYLCGLQ